MIIRLNINSNCKGLLFYNKNEDHISMPLLRYKTRLSEYEGEQLIAELRDNPDVSNIYLYKIKYLDGTISLLANANKPIGQLDCYEEF